MPERAAVDRHLALEAVRVTEAAAIAAYRLMGSGDEKIADRAAITEMHALLNRLNLDGHIRIGDGIPGGLLFTGEKIGVGSGPKVDIALVAIEGKSIVARGGPNAISVIAIAEEGSFLTVPEIYMEKIAVGAGIPEGAINLDDEPAENLKRIAEAKGVPINELSVCVLDRPRHAGLIAKIREAGARMQLILDGDVSAVISSSWNRSEVDVYMGYGGAQQGVLAAAALRGTGGQMQARLMIRNGDDRAAAHAVGIVDLDRKYSVEDMASGLVTFAATGITHGTLLDGIRRQPGNIVTQSMVLRSMSGTVRIIESFHNSNQTHASSN